MGVRPLLDPSELTVVRKGPAATPEFAREWMRILEGDPAAVGASYMADDDPALDRIFPNESCNFRMSAWLRVVERAAAFSFVQCDAPSVSMWTGGTAAPHQPGKAEADIRWHIGVHPQQFARAAIPLDGYHTQHGSTFPLRRRRPRQRAEYSVSKMTINALVCTVAPKQPSQDRNSEF